MTLVESHGGGGGQGFATETSKCPSTQDYLPDSEAENLPLLIPASVLRAQSPM